ncbi:hypothetical protein BGZ94_010276 [Podila epigama]|nr:hypothetical protein BGZ94_010276 [Podila epigama]
MTLSLFIFLAIIILPLLSSTQAALTTIPFDQGGALNSNPTIQSKKRDFDRSDTTPFAKGTFLAAPTTADLPFPSLNITDPHCVCPTYPAHVPNRDSLYDPPIKAPQLTNEEFNLTWRGVPGTIKIGVLLPFTDPDAGYRTILSRISLSVRRFNLSLVVRDSQQPMPGTNATGGAAAISATTRLLALEVGAVVGDIASELTSAEALMTSSVGVPQYNLDVAHLRNYPYLFRSAPGVLWFLDALAAVIDHYHWRRVSVLHTLDVPGLLGEKRFSEMCEEKGIDVVKTSVPMAETEQDYWANVRSALRLLKFSDSRIHVLIVTRSRQIGILELAREFGLFSNGHVWLTTIDLSDSIARLRDPSDFNGLIMADVLWDRPGLPAYDSFVKRWTNLDPARFLVQNAINITDPDERREYLTELRHGKRSQDLTMSYLASKTYDTPAGRFKLMKEGNPINMGVSILTFRDTASVQHGTYFEDTLDIYNPIVFKDNTTNIPAYAPDKSEVNPNYDSPFGLAMIVLTTILMLAILATIAIVIIFRDNIIIKSASPLFCVLELVGAAMTLSWIYLRIDTPSDNVCRIGLMLIVVGLTINLSALVVKNYRIYRIFNSVSVINHAVSNKYLLRVVALPVILTLTFPSSQYAATYHVTVISVFMATLLEYLILFYPKLRNLFLQKRGLYVSAAREDTYMDSILGGGGITPSSAAAVAISNRRDTESTGVDFFLGEKGSVHGSTQRPKRDFEDSRRGSGVSEDLRDNPNISDLVSSYPFGQINGDYSTGSIVSPVHVPTIYGQSNLVNRGKRNGSGEKEAGAKLDHFDLSDPLGNGRQSPSRASDQAGTSRTRDGPLSGVIKRFSSESETRKQRDAAMGGGGGSVGGLGRVSKDTQSYDLHEALMAASSSRNQGDGMLTAYNGGGGFPRPRSDRPVSFNGIDPMFRDGFLLSSPASDYGARSRTNSAGEYAGMGFTRDGRIDTKNRSPKVNPLQLSSSLEVPGQLPFMSARRSIRETKLDSYTVTVPVQRQRWYILSVLAQWRMSKIIFVPQNKVLVIIDLETEKSSSLIVHSIEQGYSEHDAQRLMERRRHSSASGIGARNSKKPRFNLPNQSQQTSAINPLESTATLGPPIMGDPPSQFNTEPKAGTDEPREIVVSGLHPSVVQISSPDVGRGQSTQQQQQTEMNTTPSNDPKLVTPSSMATSRGSSQTAVPNTALSGEQGPRPGLARRLSSIPIMNNVRRMTLNFDMDMRFMDGTSSSADVEEQGEEVTLQADYVIRIISIHNDCWRVQLPDQETMDRWIEIGRQIKDENWITSRLPGLPGGSVSNINSKNRNNSNAHATVSSRRRGSGAPGSGSSDELSAGEEPTVATLSLPPLRSVAGKSQHPLHLGQESNTDEGLTNAEPSAFLEVHQRMFSDVTDSSHSSDNQARQRSRQNAAMMNQRLRDSTKPNTLLGIFQNTRSGSHDGDIGQTGPRAGVSGSLAPLLNRFKRDHGHPLQRTSSSPPQPRSSHLVVATRASSEFHPDSSTDNSPSLSVPAKEASSEPTSATTPHPLHHDLFSNFDISPTFGNVPLRGQLQKNGQGVSRGGIDGDIDADEEGDEVDRLSNSAERRRRRSDDTHLKDILAETRVAYADGQHAIYDSDDLSEGHRRYRYFGSLQYNYEDKDRFRRRGISEEDKEFPQSPEWHLTSSDLPAMEQKHGLSGDMYGDGIDFNDGVSSNVGRLGLGLGPVVSVTAPDSEPVRAPEPALESEPVLESEPLSVPVPMSAPEPESMPEPIPEPTPDHDWQVEQEQTPMESLVPLSAVTGTDSELVFGMQVDQEQPQLPPSMLPKYNADRKDSYQDMNTTQMEESGSHVSAHPSPTVDSEQQRAFGASKGSN